MNWFVDTRRWSDPRLIGPGRLVLVVGPSGAGKDTLIDGARAACAGDPGIVFVRRFVTRPPSASETNTQLTAEQFDREAAAGAFALHWQAHGNKYGIPVSMDAEIAAGRTVVCNGSRTAVEPARRRYANVTVVLVTAPPEVLAQRLQARGRDSDGDMGSRLQRARLGDEAIDADCIIDNAGRPQAGIRRLLNAIHDHGFVLIT